MKTYGTVSSAEDAPLLKNKAQSSSSNFKRLAAATLLAGGVFAVASKNTSSFAIGGGRNHEVRGLGDALDDAKAGAFFFLLLLLLGNKWAAFGDHQIFFSLFTPLMAWIEQKAPKRHSKARSDERFIDRRASIALFFSSAMSYSSAKGKIRFSGFPLVL